MLIIFENKRRNLLDEKREHKQSETRSPHNLRKKKKKNNLKGGSSPISQRSVTKIPLNAPKAR